MSDIKDKFSILKKPYFQAVSILLLFALAIGLLWFGNSTSSQAIPALVAQVYFDGEYRIEDGEWHDIVEGEHISSTKGDVTLRGNFHMLAPDGEYIGIYRGDLPIAFYTNHINLTFYEGSGSPVSIDMENRLYGSSACGVSWTAHSFFSESDQTIEIVVHNPHAYGNENAIDEMLSGIALWTGIDFEKNVLLAGEGQRNTGIILMLLSIVFLGIALFSSLIHVKSSRIIWLIGLVVLFAGLYVVYSAHGISFWSESIITNTTVLGLSMMLYMLFVSMITACFVKSTRFYANATVLVLLLVDAVLFILPIITDLFFYDSWIWWVLVQAVANTVLSACLIKEFSEKKTSVKWIYLGVLSSFVSFGIDALATGLGAWEGGIVSQHVFMILIAVATVMILKLIPHNINVATKAKELEMEKIVLNAELAESRISTMMSQIRPHFVYNTLGSIEQLCKLDPQKAGELVHSFAKYLRGNFGELDNPKPILMSQEMEHVHHYVSIENVRFPDMTFTFQMNSSDFHIPALTVQPIVENAIKHGLMKLPSGGTINVISYETDTHYCISVVDDGVGFDTEAHVDDRKHLGLRNIRERLKVMVSGTLEIESAIGVGTRVLIKIPKEAQK